MLGQPPASEPGLLFFVMVDSVAAAIDRVVANGGVVVQPIGADASEITARFRDPAGNVIGLYQEHVRDGSYRPDPNQGNEWLPFGSSRRQRVF